MSKMHYDKKMKCFLKAHLFDCLLVCYELLVCGSVLIVPLAKHGRLLNN